MNKLTYVKSLVAAGLNDMPYPIRARYQAINIKAREQALALAINYHGLTCPATPRPYKPPQTRRRIWKQRNAERLAVNAGFSSDEHGTYYTRGDHFIVTGLDFVPPWESAESPYFDLGREGLGIIRVRRHRVYPKSSRWHWRDTESNYLVGKNESGTYFAHCVPLTENTVRDALKWIWKDREHSIIARQGDIALSMSPRRHMSPVVPPLPDRHTIDQDAGVITHPSHPDIPMPKTGERIIIARRAVAYANPETRD